MTPLPIREAMLRMPHQGWAADRWSPAILTAVLFSLPSLALAQTHELVHAKDGSGVFGYKDTPIQPWSAPAGGG